jgi:hypothetical protein
MFQEVLTKILTLGAAAALVSGIAVAGATLPALPEQAQADLEGKGAQADVEEPTTLQGQPEQLTENGGSETSVAVHEVFDSWFDDSDPSAFGQGQAESDDPSKFGREVAEAASGGAVDPEGLGGQGVDGPQTAEDAGKPAGVGTQSDAAAGNAAEHRQDDAHRPINDE